MAARKAAPLAGWRRQAVRRMEASRAEMLRLVARLPEAEVLRPRTQDAWSIKDVLAHLLAGDEETLRRFHLIALGQADRIQWFDLDYAHLFNARAVALGRRLDLKAILGRMKRARARLIAGFRRLPDAALRDPGHDYTVVSWLPAPGWSHEREHAREIRAWWRAQRGARTRGR